MIGIGTTVLSRGLANKHLDGIGVYTSQILSHLKHIDMQMLEIDFSQLKPSFAKSAALSSLIGLPFLQLGKIEREISLFHATDHHIPKLRKTPVISTIMDIIPLIHPEWVSLRLRPHKNFAFKKSIGWSEHIITISQYSKQDMVEHLGINPSKISVVSLGVNQKFSTQQSNEQKLETKKKYNIDKPYFIYVGTIQPRKNIHRIIDAYLSLPQYVKQNNALVLIGKYGWGEDGLQQKVKELATTNNIIWLQNVQDNDLIALMQDSISLVYPSLYEGFGLPVLEGFAAGVPVISSNTTSIPEVAHDAALLVNPLSTDEIAQAMQDIASDTLLRNKYIEKGNKRVLEFSWDKCALAHDAIYKQFS